MDILQSIVDINRKNSENIQEGKGIGEWQVKIIQN